MAKVILNYNQNKIVVQCQISDTFNTICKSFTTKANSDINKLIFLYGGESLDKKKTFKKLLIQLIFQKRK